MSVNVRFGSVLFRGMSARIVRTLRNMLIIHHMPFDPLWDDLGIVLEHNVCVITYLDKV